MPINPCPAAAGPALTSTRSIGIERSADVLPQAADFLQKLQPAAAGGDGEKKADRDVHDRHQYPEGSNEQKHHAIGAVRHGQAAADGLARNPLVDRAFQQFVQNGSFKAGGSKQGVRRGLQPESFLSLGTFTDWAGPFKAWPPIP